MTRVRLLTRCIAAFGLALFIGLFLGQAALLMSGTEVSHVIRWEVREAPASDGALLAWLESNPETRAPEVERVGTTITIRYRADLTTGYQTPPAGSLGYRVARARLSTDFFTPALETLDANLVLITLIAGQAGFLAVGWVKFRALKAELPTPRWPLARMVLVGLGAGLVLLALNGVVGMVVPRLAPIDASRAVQFPGVTDYPRQLQFLFAATAILVAPVAEELFFRGVLFGEIATHGHPVMGALVSSALFAVIHLHPLAIVVSFAMGLALAAVYHRTGSLTPAMIAHGVNNVVGVAALLAW